MWQLVGSPINVHHAGQKIIVGILVKDCGKFKFWIFSSSVLLPECLAGQLLDDDIRHGQMDKFISCEDFVGLGAQNAHAVRGVAFSLRAMNGSTLGTIELLVSAVVART
jgi:hypothetical protein